jgi:hypothetical protein
MGVEYARNSLGAIPLRLTRRGKGERRIGIRRSQMANADAAAYVFSFLEIRKLTLWH